jgi:hypothetical protein
MSTGYGKKRSPNAVRPGQSSIRRGRKVLLRILLSAMGLVLAVFGLFGVGLYMVVHQPGDYQPRYLTQEEKVWADEQAGKKIEQLFNETQQDDVFTLSIDQQLVNALLMLDDLEPWGYRRNLPQAAEQFAQAQVAFKDDRIYLMGRVTYEGVNTVMTIALEPKITAEGKLSIILDAVKAGALKMPDGVVNRQLQEQLKRLKVPLEEGDSAGGEDRYYINGKELSDSLGVMVLGFNSKAEVTTEAVFGTTDDREIRIEGITIESGRLELALKPKFIDK